MQLENIIESILFVSSKPLSFKKLAEVADVKMKEVEDALTALQEKYSKESSGIVFICANDAAQLVTHPELSKTVSDFLKEDVSGELTRPALETLSIIAYRGPVAKHEIENIRGVNCSQSLRNLCIRGLIESSQTRGGEKLYSLTFDFMRLLGITAVKDLPDFQSLSRHEKIDALVHETDVQANSQQAI